MRKKIFAVALAAVMTVTSAMSAFAETKAELTSSDPFVNTGDEKLEGDFDITYTFHTASTLAANWDTFAIEFYSDAVETGSTGKGFLTLRADAYGWWAEGWLADSVEGQTDVNANWTGNDAGWDTWMTDVADADVTINAKRAGEVISVEYAIKGTNGSSYNFTNSIENVGGFGDYVYAHLTMAQTAGVEVSLTNIKFTNNGAAGNDTPAADDDQKPADGNDTPATNDKPATDAPATNAPAGNGNAGGASTGDVAPYAVAVLAVAAAAVVVVLQKKKVTE